MCISSNTVSHELRIAAKTEATLNNVLLLYPEEFRIEKPH